MGIISTNSTQLSGVDLSNIKPDMRFCNEAGFNMIMLECALFEQDIFNSIVQADYAELSYYADKNSINEAVMMSVLKETTKEGSNRIVKFFDRMIQAIVGAFKYLGDLIGKRVTAVRLAIKKHTLKIAKSTSKSAVVIEVKSDAIFNKFSGLTGLYKGRVEEALDSDTGDTIGDKNIASELSAYFTGGTDTSQLKKYAFDELFTPKTISSIDLKVFMKTIDDVEKLKRSFNKLEKDVIKTLSTIKKDVVSKFDLKWPLKGTPVMSAEKVQAVSHISTTYITSISALLGKIGGVISGALAFNAKTIADVAASKENAGADNNVEAIYESWGDLNEAYGDGGEFVDSYDTIVDSEDQEGRMQTPEIDPTKDNTAGGAEDIEITGARSGQVSNGEYEDDFDDDFEDDDDDCDKYGSCDDKDLEEAFKYFDDIIM